MLPPELRLAQTVIVPATLESEVGAVMVTTGPPGRLRQKPGAAKSRPSRGSGPALRRKRGLDGVLECLASCSPLLEDEDAPDDEERGIPINWGNHAIDSEKPSRTGSGVPRTGSRSLVGVHPGVVAGDPERAGFSGAARPRADSAARPLGSGSAAAWRRPCSRLSARGPAAAG